MVMTAHLAQPRTRVQEDCCAHSTPARWRACMYIKKRSKRATTKSSKQKHPTRFVLPENEIQDLALNLPIREAHKAALCLLIIDLAAKAVEEERPASGELDLRLIRQMVEEEECRPIQRLIKAIIAAVEQGAEGASVARLTITRFLEFAFEYTPDRGMAEAVYDSRLSKISRAS